MSIAAAALSSLPTPDAGSAANAASAPVPNALLSLRHLSKAFDGVPAVSAISLDIEQGEIFVLLGSSGCGKSTLLRMLAGFETPDAGQILLDGQDMVRVPPYQRPVNMMFQSYALFPHLSVWDNVAFGLHRDGLPKDAVAARVEQMLALVQMSSFAKRKPHQLSGGQQQRVALARSLSKRPQLLLLDEPLGALDKQLRERTQIELKSVIEQVGVTCVMVTHDQDEAMSMATRIGVMSEGRIVQVGTPDAIYERPNCRFVADFIGSVNLFDGRTCSGGIESDSDSDSDTDADYLLIDSNACLHAVPGLEHGAGMAVTLALRPEKINLQAHAPTLEQRASVHEHGHNWAQGHISAIAYFGNETRYHVRLDRGLDLKVTRSNAARHDSSILQREQRVCVWWDGADINLLTC